MLVKDSGTLLGMATTTPNQGPTGRYVGAVLQAVRKNRAMTLRELSAKLDELGHKMSHTTLSQLETGNRRMTVDDLFILAVALNVSPIAFLMPQTKTPQDEVELTGVGTVEAIRAYWWITGQYNVGDRTDLNWIIFSRPPWDSPTGVQMLEFDRYLDERQHGDD